MPNLVATKASLFVFFSAFAINNALRPLP